MTRMKVLVFCPNCGKHLGYCTGNLGETIFAKDFIPLPGYKGDRPKDHDYSYCDVCKAQAVFDGTKVTAFGIREGSRYGKEDSNGR